MKNKEILDSLVLLQKSYDYLYNVRTEKDEALLCGVQSGLVNLTFKGFQELFGLNGELTKRNCETYPYEISTTYKDVKFIALLTSEDTKEFYNVEE